MEIERLPSTDRRVERVRFNGVIYRRYPRAKQAGDRLYFRCSHRDVLRGFSSLHRDVWKFHHGPIPAGHEIHHRDRNPLNNAVDNLECLSKPAHLAAHGPLTGRRKSAAAFRKTAAYARLRLLRSANRWHRSAEGREWHRRHAREVWANRQAVARQCECCGERFATRKADAASVRFCSNRCRAKARRLRRADHERRDCAYCGGPFSVSRFAPTRCCSRSCANRHRTAGATPGLQPDG